MSNGDTKCRIIGEDTSNVQVCQEMICYQNSRRKRLWGTNSLYLHEEGPTCASPILQSRRQNILVQDIIIAIHNTQQCQQCSSMSGPGWAERSQTFFMPAMQVGRIASFWDFHWPQVIIKPALCLKLCGSILALAMPLKPLLGERLSPRGLCCMFFTNPG